MKSEINEEIDSKLENHNFMGDLSRKSIHVDAVLRIHVMDSLYLKRNVIGDCRVKVVAECMHKFP